MSLSPDAAAIDPAAAIVAVPVRNEADRLPALIASLGGQRLSAEKLTVILLLNNCSDNSREAAETSARRWPRLDVRIRCASFAGDAAHVGNARRLALDAGLEILRRRTGDLRGAALLSTDADAVLPPDWVARNLEAIGQGAALVGGRITGDRLEEAAFPEAVRVRAKAIGTYQEALTRLETLIDPVLHDPWPRHGDHLGASLAINAAVYEDVGGLPPLPCREDLALAAAVRRHGHRMRHCPNVTATVSARLTGRASGGMADALNAWHADAEVGRPILVECPRRAEARFRQRRFLRHAFARRDDRGALRRLMKGHQDAPRWMDLIETSRSDGALIEVMAPDEPDAPATIPVWQALAQLRTRNEELAKRYGTPITTH